jgi:hypothetical protein
LCRYTTAYCLGILWNKRCSWWVTIPASAAVRSAGIFASLALSSVILRENVMALLVTQMYGLLDQMAANIGATFMPNITWVGLSLPGYMPVFVRRLCAFSRACRQRSRI